jgi:hypothetical protein
MNPHVATTRGQQAREARRIAEAALDRPWSRGASLWLDALLVLEEQGA